VPAGEPAAPAVESNCFCANVSSGTSCITSTASEYAKPSTSGRIGSPPRRLWRMTPMKMSCWTPMSSRPK
jgi:hypothetical protein